MVCWLPKSKPMCWDGTLPACRLGRVSQRGTGGEQTQVLHAIFFLEEILVWQVLSWFLVAYHFSVLVASSPSCTSTVGLAEFRFLSASRAVPREHLGKWPVSDSESTLQSCRIWLQGFGRCFLWLFASCLWRCCCVRFCPVCSTLWPRQGSNRHCQTFKTGETGWVSGCFPSCIGLILRMSSCRSGWALHKLKQPYCLCRVVLTIWKEVVTSWVSDTVDLSFCRTCFSCTNQPQRVFAAETNLMAKGHNDIMVYAPQCWWAENQ